MDYRSSLRRLGDKGASILYLFGIFALIGKKEFLLLFKNFNLLEWLTVV
jgi:hypothetical protein